MLHRACVEFLVDNKGTSNRMSVNHLWLQCCKYLPKEVEVRGYRSNAVFRTVL